MLMRCVSELPDTSAIDWVLSTTRSVRRRLDLERPVSRDVVLECLRLALQAPTSSNSQRWHWLVIDDPEVKAQIAETYRNGGKDYFEARVAELDSLPDKQRRVFESGLYLRDNLHRVPVIVIPAIATEEQEPGVSSAGQTAAVYGSILPAAWSFHLALRSRGLGSVWTTLHLEQEDAARSILGIPQNVAQVALFPVAYTKGTDFKPAQRTVPLESIVHWNHW